MTIMDYNRKIKIFRGGKGPYHEPIWEDVSIPHANFGWVPFTVQQQGTLFRPAPTWTLASMIDQTGGARFVKKGGSDANSGTSWAAAWKKINYAIANAPDNGVIYVDSGIYGWTDGGTASIAWGKNLSLIGVGDVIIDAYIEPTWAKTDGKTYTYQTAWVFGPTLAVFDYSTPDGDGAPLSYAQKASVDDVESEAGSFYWNSNVLYVRPLASGAPSASVRPQYGGNAACRFTADDRKAYLENLNLYASPILIENNSAAGGSAVYLKDCQIMYSNSLVSLRGVDAILQNCKIAHNRAASDAIFGDVKNSVVCRVIEIDCHVWDIGVNNGDDSWNATTNHGAGKNVILNGEYHHTWGPPIGFINDGEAWLLGTYAHNSLAETKDWAKTNFLIEEVLAYLDSCKGSDSKYDFAFGASHNVYARNFDGTANITGGGTLQAY